MKYVIILISVISILFVSSLPAEDTIHLYRQEDVLDSLFEKIDIPKISFIDDEFGKDFEVDKIWIKVTLLVDTSLNMRVYRFKPLYGFMNNIPKNHQIFDTLQVLISNTLLAAELKTIYWDLPDSTMDKDLYRYKKAANNGNLSKIHLPYSGKQIHTVFWVIDTDRKTSAIQFFETYYIW